MGAEGKNWYDKCEDLARRIKEWIMLNTNTHDLLYIMIEEPVNMVQSRAWSAALQNRLLSLLVDRLSSLDQRTVKISILFPMTMKRVFTGKGNSNKDTVVQVASSFYKFKKHHTKRIQEAIADAIGVAYCCWVYNRSGAETTQGVTDI